MATVQVVSSYYRNTDRDKYDINRRYRVIVLQIEYNNTKRPTWREVEIIKIGLEWLQAEFRAESEAKSRGLSWIHGICPNTAVSKKQAIKLFPHLKGMPGPIIDDYLRDLCCA